MIKKLRSMCSYALAAFVLLMLLPGIGRGQESVIYTTGFESSDGFTASTSYNNTAVKYQGPVGSQWGIFMGTASTTGPITSLQSMQMRSYASNTTLGSVFTNFDLANVTKVTFKAKAYDANTPNFSAYYSTDGGTSWSSATNFTVTTTSADYTYNISVTGEFPSVRIKIEHPTYNVAGRLTIDDVSIYGMVAGPTISVIPGSLSGFMYEAGNGPSSSQSYNLSGTNLTGFPGNITITGSTNYEVSTDDVTFYSSRIVAYTSAILASKTIYVRLKSGLSGGNYNSEAITNAGGGATTANVTCSGTVSFPVLTLPLYENFNYADDSYLTSNGWVAHSGAGTNPIAVGASNGLTYSGYSGVSGVTGVIEGNAALLDNNGEDDSKTFTAVKSGTVYFSFLTNVTTGTAGYYIHLGGSTSSFAARIFVQPSSTAGKINFGISNSSTASYATIPTDFDPGTTYLLIVKYDVSATGDASLWVKATGVPETEVSVGSPECTTTGGGQASIDRICLRQYSATQSMVIDGIRVGASWADIIPAGPPPTAYAVTGSGSYCQGSGGLAVGLANSQTGVDYQLYVSGQTPVGSTIAGTGSAITFGTQLTGTYTVKGTNTGGTTDMTGNAVLIETSQVTPTFAQLGPYCVGATPGTLPLTSINSITGTWNAAISTTAPGTITYTFTPTTGQCATTATMEVLVNANVTPTFTQLGPYTLGDTPGVLPSPSQNDIAGTWNPATITTDATGTITYTFTPTAGQCATTATMDVLVTPPSSTWTGIGNWSASVNWSNGIPTSAIDAIIDGDVTIDVAAETKDLTINEGKLVTISDTKSLTVSGTLTNSAGTSGLVVNSGGSLIANNSVQATVKRDYSGGTNFHLFCLPVSGASISASPTFNGAWLDEYVESSGAWNRLGNVDNVVSGKGYSINFEAANTPLSFSGSIYSVDQIMGSLTYTVAATGYGPGWHLLGNPFTAALDLNSTSWAVTNIDAYAYVWDGSNYLVGPTLPADANGYTYGTLTDNILPAMQGFFVHANAGNASITIPAAARTHSNQAFYKSTSAAKDALFLTIDGNGYQDKAIVAFNPSATANFDGQYDAYKLFGIDAAPQLYSMIPGEKATVNTLPDYTSNPNVSLGLKVGAATTYTLNVSGMDSFDASLPVNLYDLKTGTTQDLRLNAVYSFTAAPGDAENRFMLSFGAVTGLDKPAKLGINMVAANGTIRITHDAPASGTVYLYSVSGQLLGTSTLNAGETTLRTASTGVFMVKVVTGKTTYTRKMVVVQ